MLTNPEKKLINRNLHKNKCTRVGKSELYLTNCQDSNLFKSDWWKNYGDGVGNSIMGKGNILWVLPSEALLVSHSEYQRKSGAFNW